MNYRRIPPNPDRPFREPFGHQYPPPVGTCVFCKKPTGPYGSPYHARCCDLSEGSTLLRMD